MGQVLSIKHPTRKGGSVRSRGKVPGKGHPSKEEQAKCGNRRPRSKKDALAKGL